MSARSRWSKCAVSVPWSENLPNESGPAAEEGTIAHKVAEFYVRQRFGLEGAKPGIPPEYQPPAGLDLKGQTVNAWNAKMRLHGQDYAAFIATLVGNFPDVSVVLEKRVAVDGITPPLFGTADCLLWFPGIRRLAGVDYKYGFGEVDVGTVDAPNAQVAAYAVAAAETFKLAPLTVGLAIYQPRRIHGEPGQVLLLPETWLASERAKLLAEARQVEAAFAGLLTTPVPGSHCRYCPVAKNARCPAVSTAGKVALQAHTQAALVHDMTDAEILALWSVKSAFKHFWEDIEERIDEMADKGAAGLVVKVATGRKMWADPDAAVFTLLALNRLDLLAPAAIGEALAAIPAEMQVTLIKRAAGARAILTTEAADPLTVAATFDKYAHRTLDKPEKNA
jgi:hypothetical protein